MEPSLWNLRSRMCLATLLVSLVLSEVIFGQSWGRPRHQYQAIQHLLQECEAELPDECPTLIKALDQSCVMDSECVTPAKCLDFKCKCPQGFLPLSGKCIQAGLHQPCVDGKCASSLICTRSNVCECPPGMEPNGQACQPQCPEGEIAHNGQCLRLEKVGGRCNESIQCQTAYSYCRNEKCECVLGTRERNGECQPTYLCPDGQRPIEDPQRRDEPVRCNAQTCLNQQTYHHLTVSKIKLDTCPVGSYCVFPSYQDSIGFCCPEKPYCPVGEPLAGKVCSNPRNELERCPRDTHHCYAGPRGPPACCPLPCPSIIVGDGSSAVANHVVVDKGLCYPRKSLGHECLVSAQCPPSSACENGTCQCPDGYLKQFGPAGEKCVRLCAAGEVLVRTECLSLVVPTKECVHSAQCTAGSRCINGKCQCPCGTILYNGQCVEKPQCPNFGTGIHDPISTLAGAVVECSPAGAATSNGTCPERSFCYPAMVYSGGICCPFPEPVCNFGQQPPTDRRGEIQMCDLPLLTGGREQCPRDQYCNDYTITLLPSLGATVFDRKGVCCWERQPFGPPPWPTTSGVGRFPTLDPGLCPSNHRPLVQFGNRLSRCNFYAYLGECGQRSGCFLHRDSPRFLQHESGVCCIWVEG